MTGRTLALRNDGHILLVTGSSELEVWDITPAKKLKLWHHTATMSALSMPATVVLSPDAECGILIRRVRGLNLQDFRTQKQLELPPRRSPLSVLTSISRRS